ncbi:MAG: glycerol-3-phosphate acyltransferase [Xenococcaceae cyanobacterium MO_167.B27]|nr:glycerol-3-phosphate acyltransferase [Xenococcaceae cyanobacterium MO_167.B27]
MTLAPIWGSLIIFLFCPLLGGLPLIDWLTYGFTGRQLAKLGTGNISVSAAFAHGGKFVGVLAVLSEAAKGIIAVLLTRLFFPSGSFWELLALIALVMGRYWMGKGAGTTNVVWGIVAHDPVAAGLIFLIGGISFTINRDRKAGKLGILVLLVIIIGLRHPTEPEYFIIATALGSLLAWIYQQIPDDLDLPENSVSQESRGMFRFFRGDKNLLPLDKKLDGNKVGNKAANLSLVKRLGYSVPDGWVLVAGDDLKPVVESLQPSPENPLVVRSSATGEDSNLASAAGQYSSFLNITSSAVLQTAILDCQASYLENNALEYRKTRQQEEGSMAVLIQKQIIGVYSGVAFSRDPIDRFQDAVAIEAVSGQATEVVSGRITPYRYQVIVPSVTTSNELKSTNSNSLQVIPDAPVPANAIPDDILESVAILAREMEDIFQGVPQDIEWTHDGEKLWLLQVRPITNLQPIWTRKIAAEVIPGHIQPLTWSINQPLTCGVWGELFTLVLGKKVEDLDFNQTANLHYGRAYFNATLLGEIFLRMGLPPESLEFLIRGEKFSRPPITSTLKNLPGLWKLLQRELKLATDFEQDSEQLFQPLLEEIAANPIEDSSPPEIITRIDNILKVLQKATYYSILAPLSLALRQAILKVPDTELDNSKIPEIASMRSLATLACDTLKLLTAENITIDSSASLFAYIAEHPEGESILQRFDELLTCYGYLSEVATNIAVPCWRDNSSPVREMFARFFFDPEARKLAQSDTTPSTNHWQNQVVQKRLNLKGEVSVIYNKLLANLRWSFLALGTYWLDLGILSEVEAIFWLKFSEIKDFVSQGNNLNSEAITKLISVRKQQWQQESQLTLIPYLMYGEPQPLTMSSFQSSSINNSQTLTGIGASNGMIEGKIQVLQNLNQTIDIDRQTILVVPYTDAGWSPLLARAGGLISEVGGRLSHGAIIAREYGIPAVMNVPYATQILQAGKRVRIDGQAGIVEILD